MLFYYTVFFYIYRIYTYNYFYFKRLYLTKNWFFDLLERHLPFNSEVKIMAKEIEIPSGIVLNRFDTTTKTILFIIISIFLTERIAENIVNRS